jgi:hypothetical protein
MAPWEAGKPKSCVRDYADVRGDNGNWRVVSDPKNTWSIVAPFFSRGAEYHWIDDVIARDGLTFRKIPKAPSRDNWHNRSKRATGLATWADYWRQSKQAFPAAGIITLFPQLALTAGIQKSFFDRDVPLIAWCFNLGEFPSGWKRAGARLAFKSVDRFVVHSSAEISLVADFLDIPRDKVEFVHLQRAPIPMLASEDLEQPFIVSMGSANRDYSTFFKAAEISGLPCVVVAPARSIEGLNIPPNVEVRSNLDASECHRLVQRSRFTVVPLINPQIASGQVTVIESMRMNRPVVATDSIGTQDYVQDGSSGVLVQPHDPHGLAGVMIELWEDSTLRQRYARKAANFAEHSLSDEAAARSLCRVISDLERNR